MIQDALVLSIRHRVWWPQPDHATGLVVRSSTGGTTYELSVYCPLRMARDFDQVHYFSGSLNGDALHILFKHTECKSQRASLYRRTRRDCLFIHTLRVCLLRSAVDPKKKGPHFGPQGNQPTSTLKRVGNTDSVLVNLHLLSGGKL